MNPEWKKLPALDREDSRPLHAQLFAIITDFIQENHISPGALLPTEIELMQWFGLSRTPVRQAIQQLENRGMVRKIQGKGEGRQALPES
jgi:GntR family transcriptional regulator